ncbi:hypothetical protein GCK72_025144 [Caenorhabditis remanei]|uniref:Ubiquitin-like protease family profile domain-containing protein n=1 Tax=Caenorhabditis remanei TaxID=31234 RepID=A0A6A5G146_CAERE|nr:hypothetical protein GCK72_025144 [Caenorhabditis remanei]KAF1748677.1 hypothetical protein GCK72_025144 [Caenorhabditis remanei]
MSSEPDEEYDPVEVEIMRRLEPLPGCQYMYEGLRKTETNPNFLYATGSVKMLEFKKTSEFNLLGTLEGDIYMSDIRTLGRDLFYEEQIIYTIRDDMVRYGMAEILNWQKSMNQYETICFDLNTCGIHLTNSTANNFLHLIENFNQLVSKIQPEDIFPKNYILFPAHYDGHFYCTLIHNALGAMKMEVPYRDGRCTMVHIGTNNSMNNYENVVVPNILKLLNLFTELYASEEGYDRLLFEKIDVVNKFLPPMQKAERPIEFLHMFKKILSPEFSIRNWNEAVDSIGVDMEKTLAEMAKIRENMSLDICAEIREGTDEVAKHLYEKRLAIIRYEAIHGPPAGVSNEQKDSGNQEQPNE